jgi:hypothetical protein
MDQKYIGNGFQLFCGFSIRNIISSPHCISFFIIYLYILIGYCITFGHDTAIP